ncbi:MAG: substrate-binding domain-containing protein [Blautia sp.]|nr:substrate-binding domain-containing protein [Blautia sp.]
MKRILAMLLATMMLSTCVMATEADTGSTEGIQSDPEFYAKADLSVLEGKKLGITIQDLKNPYWAGVMTALDGILTEAGAEFTILGCNQNAIDQQGQIENFAANGCDLIMVHPQDPAGADDALGMVREQYPDIKLMCWDDPLENTDANWILDNTYLGTVIGQMAAEFINEHFTEDNKAEVIVIGKADTPVLVERENGIKAGLEDAAGKYEIVATNYGIEPLEAQEGVETTLQAYPNVKVVAGVGAGAMIGADEALNIHTGGDIPEDMGVFTTDVTMQQLEQLADPTYPAKGIIGFEGSDHDTALACAQMYALILADEVGAKNVFRPVNRFTEDTAEEVMDGMTKSN